MEPAPEIRMVRDNLSLAVSLWRSTGKGLITSAHLLTENDMVNANPATVRSIAGEWVVSPAPRPSREDLLRRMTNQVRASFCFLSVANPEDSGASV